jgi:hypothetical protein
MVLKVACYVLDFIALMDGILLSLRIKDIMDSREQLLKLKLFLNYCVNIQKITSLNIS